MNVVDALAILANSSTVVASAATVVRLLRQKDAQAVRAVGLLPAHADAQAIVDAVLPARGGNVFVAAGHNGGGNAFVNANMSAGNGRMRGGDLVLQAGSGGPNGRGGDLVIGPGTYRGGDGTG